MSVSVRQANINLSEMRNLKIPVPLLELQEKFALIAKRIEQIREKQNSSKLEINKLFDSLVNKAFNGKLNTTVD
jgi:type I restriction enzyme S subunit